MYDFDQRSDSIIEEQDLERISREINHNNKKQDHEKKNKEKGLRPDGTPLVRQADGAQNEQMIGGDNMFEGAANRRGQFINEDGMIVPASMRNYQEKVYLFGFLKLRRYDKIDLFWGYLNNQQRDLVYMHLMVLSFTVLIFAYVLFTDSQ